MIYIYVLQLQSNKYYIGKTENPEFRLADHFISEGSAWTKKYKPIKIKQIIPNCDAYDEDKYTKKYMSKYGINNVRGGTYCRVKLNDEIIKTIKKEIDGATDKCYKCGKTGHFANECIKKQPSKQSKNNKCFRCNRVGHYASNCYAKTYANGEYIDTSEEFEEFDDSIEYDDSEEYVEQYMCQYCNRLFDTLKGATFHENVHCKMNTNRRNRRKYNFISSNKFNGVRNGYLFKLGKKGLGYYRDL